MLKENSNTTNLDDSGPTEQSLGDPLMSFCNALPDPIYAFDSQGLLKTINDSGAQLQGRSAAWLQGKRCWKGSGTLKILPTVS